MKSCDLLECANVDLGRFKVFKQRDQLPFVCQEGRGADYTAEDAFRLGLMLAATDEAGMKLGIARDMAMQVSVGPHVWKVDESGDLWAVAFLVCDGKGVMRFTYDLNRRNDIAWRDAGSVVSATFVNAAKVAARVLSRLPQEVAA
jgi:hypothetical protein